MWRKTPEGRCPLKVSAPEYIQFCCAYLESLLQEPEIFPDYEEDLYPDDFLNIIREMYRLILRIFEILYQSFETTLKENEWDEEVSKLFHWFVLYGYSHNIMPGIQAQKPLRGKIVDILNLYLNELPNEDISARENVVEPELVPSI